jgi:ribosomal protein S18 acetylase RimI-like enzyme
MPATGAQPPSAVAIRPLTHEDGRAFALFASLVPDGDRRFLKEDLQDSAGEFARFLREAQERRLVAVTESGIVGVAGAFPGSGWSSHVAELRVLVAPSHRGRGLGRELARSALVAALELGCTHAYVEVVAEQEALVSMFQDLGFVPEAILADFVRDGEGQFHDLMLLTHRAQDQVPLRQVLDLLEVGP